MEEKYIKEERISDDEEAAINEEKVFLAEPIKIEYPLDHDEYNSTSGFGSLGAKLELYEANHEPMLEKQERMDIEDQSGSQRVDRSAVHDSSFVPSSQPTNFDQVGEEKTLDKEDKTKQVRCLTSQEVGELLERREQLIRVHVTDSDSSLNQHVMLPVNIEDKPFKCDGCERYFSQSSDLKRHKRLHSVEPFQCDKCDLKFSRYSLLNKHSRSHSSEKPFQCNECGKRFALNNYLKSHQRTHLRVKPFQCNQCNQTFSHRPALKAHLRIHTGLKPFSCNECEKQFLRNGDLKKHLRTHTGEKPYQCNECNKTFALSGNLKKHQRFHKL